MESRKFGFGIFLVAIGIIFILINIHIIDETIIYGLYMLWPLILIVVGVNVVFRRNHIVRTITWLTFLAVLITFSYAYRENGDFGKPIISKQISEDKLAETKNGALKLAMGGLNVNVDSTDTKLMDAYIYAKNITNDFNLSEGNDLANFSFKRDEYMFTIPNFGGKQKCDFHLNSDVIWSLDLDMGMSKVTIDASDLIISKLDIDSGLTKFDIKLGNRSTLTEIDVDTGVSSFDLSVPKDSGIKIKIDGGLYSKDFNGLSLHKDGNYYISENYDEAISKINMDIDMGVSNLQVSGY